jgi:hypothetical protein
MKGPTVPTSEPVAMSNHERHLRELISLGESLFERHGFVPSSEFVACLAAWRCEVADLLLRRLAGEA